MKSRKFGFLMLVVVLAACQAPSAEPDATAVPTASPSPTSTATPAPKPSAVPPTASPSPSPPPPSRIFTEEFAGVSPYWDYVQVDTGAALPNPKVAGGFLVFDLPSPNQWVYGIYGPFEYADVRLDAAAQVRSSGSDAVPGLICRYDETRGWYEFDILDDRTYVLLYGQWLAEGVARYTPLVQAESEKIVSGENELGLLCQGDVLTPFINGTQLRRRQESTYGLTGGKVGIAAASFEQAPAEIAFDWLKVSLP
jgi:hypothetical protein